MLEAVIVQGLFKLALALIGVLGARLVLKWMDKFLVNGAFDIWLKGASDNAKAHYYGYRIIAVCLLIGFAIS